MSEQETKKSGGVKAFFKSGIFKGILIAVLYIIDYAILSNLAKSFADNPKPMLIYYVVCAILSASTLIAFHNSSTEAVRKAKSKGPIRIMSERQYYDEKSSEAITHMIHMLFFTIMVAPFAAPVNLGKLIHSVLCKVLK
ncbi:MAG: hypothetical protein IJ642_08645 [Oscillospiraceae bacterium]|nr:hypothetical protein [Oscillospiraceae bacterium]